MPFLWLFHRCSQWYQIWPVVQGEAKPACASVYREGLPGGFFFQCMNWYQGCKGTGWNAAQSRFPNSRNRLPLGFNFLLRFTVPSRATSKHMNDFCTVMLWSLICGQSCLLWYEDVVNKIEQWGSAVCPMWLCHWWFHSDACSCLLD